MDGQQSTGDERVDAAMDSLAGLEGVPLNQHPEIFEDVHRRLQDALGTDETQVP